MMKIKCSKCKHEWETKSKLILVTCPSCGLKVKRIELKGGMRNGKTRISRKETTGETA
jgi:predicted  nucleic acid-binding Zn-ribbon protein